MLMPVALQSAGLLLGAHGQILVTWAIPELASASASRASPARTRPRWPVLNQSDRRHRPFGRFRHCCVCSVCTVRSPPAVRLAALRTSFKGRVTGALDHVEQNHGREDDHHQPRHRKARFVLSGLRWCIHPHRVPPATTQFQGFRKVKATTFSRALVSPMLGIDPTGRRTDPGVLLKDVLDELPSVRTPWSPRMFLPSDAGCTIRLPQSRRPGAHRAHRSTRSCRSSWPGWCL